MRAKVASPLAWLLFAIVFLIGTPLRGQAPPNWKVLALDAVVAYRALVLNDTITKFDRCRIDRAVGENAFPFPRQNVELRRRMLGPCFGPESGPAPHVVMVDSIIGRERGATVYLWVIHGEWSHGERYELDPMDGPRPFMWVREVRLTSGAQSYGGSVAPAAAPPP
jgi:hypothetical protein